jgi:hypothetical protein
VIIGALLLAGSLTIPVQAANAVGVDCTADLALPGGEINLDDTTPARWDITSDGSVDDGALLDAPGGAPTRTDAFDSFTVFAIDDGTNGREDYANVGSTCTYELGGRQLAFPAETTTGGLELSRKVYVPSTGPGFARFYNQVHNPTGTAKTITVYTNDGAQGDLGSDSGTVIPQSSIGLDNPFVGDNLATPVSWFTSTDGDGDGDPQLAHNLDRATTATGSGVRDRVDLISQQPGEEDELNFVYQNVTVPAGGTVAYVSFESMRATNAAALAAAKFVDSQPGVVLAGLSAAEVAAVQNWTSDLDGDGRLDTADNCPAVANADQADLDKDGLGDKCDSDADGDGLANDVEAAIGTNPLGADTDADGVRDNADQCPKVAGAQANGCPPSARRASKTVVKVKGTKTGPVVLKIKGTVKTKATALPNDCTHGSAAVIVKVGSEVIATKIVKLRAATCRFKTKVAIDLPRRTIGKAKVTGWFQGSDGLLPSKDKVRFKVKTA